MNRFIGWILACFMLLLRWVTRGGFVNDPRPALRAAKTPYVMAALHAHQVAAVCHNDEKGLVAMVSRSTDGDLLVPSLKVRGIIPVRGSSSKNGKDKGGLRALINMARLMEQGHGAIITVDGPRGPRGIPQPGIAVLAQRADALVLPVVSVASRYWTLSKTWDRMQIPKPFSRVRIIYGPPIRANAFPDKQALLDEVQRALAALEREHDPTSA
ncbi:MAG: lysophospholipid acyltransferase family protein [Myxococcota bacterium]